MFKEAGKNTFGPFDNKLVASSVQLDHLANDMGIMVMGSILPLLPCLQRQDESTFLGRMISQQKKGKWLIFFIFQHSLEICVTSFIYLYM